MKKKAFVFLLIIIISVSVFPISVHADTGPKPSVQITFVNMGDEVCYGTLLSKHKSTGPASAWDGNEEHIYDNGLDREIWQAFAEHKDTDGFYFLQWGWKCNETKSLIWGYYPPDPFKILLYYPDSQTFIVSEICEKYAFDSYYTVNMSGISIDSVSEKTVLSPEKSYDYTWEIISFACRVVITILLEIGIALLFGFSKKKALLLIGGVNIATQIALNIALNVTNYYQGSTGFILNYILLELVVIAVEAVIYVLFLKKVNEKPVSNVKSIGYAFAANVASFAVGLIIAKIIPGIF